MAMTGTSLFVLILIFAPVIETLLERPVGIGSIAWLVFRPLCHQDPARSFWIAGQPLPVCARCLGIYIGGFLGLVLFGPIRGISTRSPFPRAWLIMFLIPLLADGAINALGILTTPLYIRALTGFGAGTVTAGALIPGINQLLDMIHLTHISPSEKITGDQYA
jgi:uncharacterized membrane protein